MEEPIPVELLEKYINGTCTEAEIATVKEWYMSFENDKDHVSEISAGEEKELEERIYNHILNNIGASAEDEELAEKPNRQVSRKWYSIAAAAAVIFAITALTIYSRQEIKLQQAAAEVGPQQLVSVTNNSDQIYKAKLPDNSSVWLRPLAQISYPKVFDTKSRMVTISGECFFEVTKNPKCPFIINSRSIITKVWGTSFLVRDNERSNSAEVSVVTGKVSVSIKKSDNEDYSTLKLEQGEVMLYPHQKVIYLLDQHILKPENDNAETESGLQIWKRVNLSFENKPLREIIPVLDSRYHVHITVKSEKLNHYILNADLAGFNLPDVLEALKKSLNVSYEISDDGIELE